MEMEGNESFVFAAGICESPVVKGFRGLGFRVFLGV